MTDGSIAENLVQKIEYPQLPLYCVLDPINSWDTEDALQQSDPERWQDYVITVRKKELWIYRDTDNKFAPDFIFIIPRKISANSIV